MLCWGDFGWQMHREVYCPFSGVTNYGRVWRKGGKRLGLWVPGCQLPKHFSKSECHCSYFMPEAWRLFALFSLQAKNKAMEQKAAKFQTVSWDVMVHDNWWWDASAAIKQGKLQSFDCWIRLKIVVLSTRQPDSTVPHGGQILVYPTSKQFLMVVRSWCIPPVNSSSWWSDLGVSHQ